MAQAPQRKTGSTSQPPAGPSPEALAAFYRLRSESLRNSHTTTQQGQMDTTQKKADQQPADDHGGMGIVAYLISALAGHPGKP